MECSVGYSEITKYDVEEFANGCQYNECKHVVEPLDPILTVIYSKYDGISFTSNLNVFM